MKINRKLRQQLSILQGDKLIDAEKLEGKGQGGRKGKYY